MYRCLLLAKKGLGITRPNPSVGAVVVLEDAIIGEGYTSAYGGNHAEVNAINSVVDKAQLKTATLYVTLEPCAHTGKTPPCADLILKHRIKRVVIGCVDANSLVAGKGIARLKSAGCEVLVGVLEKECLQHHKRFFTVQNKQRPYVILKWAETKDGFIAPKEKKQQAPVWISNAFSQQLVHKWRSEEHAILVGTNTVVADNPTLTVRHWSGNNPVRVVLDAHCRIPSDAAVFNSAAKTIVLCQLGTAVPVRENCIFECINFSKNIASQICNVLQEYQIQSVIVEGGAQTLQAFIDENLWDEARVFQGVILFDEGVKAPVFESKNSIETRIKDDVLKISKYD